jgi:hypothetical protein
MVITKKATNFEAQRFLYTTSSDYHLYTSRKIIDKHCRWILYRFYLRLHIAPDFLLYLPLALPLFIYIYPSNVYMSLCRELKIVKWIKLKICSHWCCTSSNIVEKDDDEQIAEEMSL